MFVREDSAAVCSFAHTSGLHASALDAKGNLYGTVTYGGPSGCGGAFQLSPGTSGWQLHMLHAFRCGSDGAYPEGSLVFDSGGRIYGTTGHGGAFNQGAVFMLAPRSGKGWANTVIHNFNGANGAQPSGAVIVDTMGDVYGTAMIGGGSQNCASGCGVAYKLTSSGSSWTHSLLHVFSEADGSVPFPLVFDGAGNLFGTTTFGGADSVGTVFEITP